MEQIAYFIIVAVVTYLVGFRFGYRKYKKDREQPVEFQIGKFDIKDGDVLILNTDRVISNDTANRFRSMIQEKFPGHQCLVLCDGMKLSVGSNTE